MELKGHKKSSFLQKKTRVRKALRKPTLANMSRKGRFVRKILLALTVIVTAVTFSFSVKKSLIVKPEMTKKELMAEKKRAQEELEFLEHVNAKPEYVREKLMKLVKRKGLPQAREKELLQYIKLIEDSKLIEYTRENLFVPYTFADFQIEKKVSKFLGVKLYNEITYSRMLILENRRNARDYTQIRINKVIDHLKKKIKTGEDNRLVRFILEKYLGQIVLQYATGEQLRDINRLLSKAK